MAQPRDEKRASLKKSNSLEAPQAISRRESPSTEDEIGPADLRKQEQMATISRKHSSESDGI
jgi:hypothetical protein